MADANTARMLLETQDVLTRANVALDTIKADMAAFEALISSEAKPSEDEIETIRLKMISSLEAYADLRIALRRKLAALRPLMTGQP